jgi:nucleoporin GLE1
LRIHRALKALRKNLVEVSGQAGSPLKGKLGDMRREVRKSMGQLTAGKGANAIPLGKLRGMLSDAMASSIPSPLVDPAQFVADKREPTGQARYENDRLPSLFIYIVNIMGKFMINQFASECGASPKAADPIGVVAAQIFSDPEFQWRGKSVIDIVLAKFRKECPVAFGIRASDKTTEGRQLIGWRRNGGWMPEQVHYDRMAGLGAGFAAIALRDFHKSKKVNPCPPAIYWTAVAKMVNSPDNLISDTQYVVLKAMLDGHEHRILQFWGSAGLALLRVALVEFPMKAPKSPSAGALRVLGEVLQTEKGLRFA